MPSLRLLAAYLLLIGQPVASHAQDLNPSPVQSTLVPSFPPPPTVGAAPAVIPDPQAAPPSPWYLDAELAVLFNTAVYFNDRVFSVRNNPVYVSPRVFLGYGFDGGGSLRLTYRNLTEVGQLGGNGGQSYGDWSMDHSFTVNWLDLDYVTGESAPLDPWRFRWEVGGRFVFFYQGWETDSAFRYSNDSMTYFGGGPHLGLSSNWLLGDSGWSLFGRADAAVTFGGGESVSRSRTGGGGFFGMTSWEETNRSSHSLFQYDVNAQLAVMKACQWRGYDARVGLGVQAEVLSFGGLNRRDSGTFGYVNVGPFLRGEVAF